MKQKRSNLVVSSMLKVEELTKEQLIAESIVRKVSPLRIRRTVADYFIAQANGKENNRGIKTKEALPPPK